MVKTKSVILNAVKNLNTPTNAIQILRFAQNDTFAKIPSRTLSD